MKIALDGQTTVIQKSGFGFYTDNLTKNLQTISPKDEFVLIKPNTSNDFNTPKRILWDQFLFPLKAKLLKPDIIHQTCFSAPILFHSKKVVTIHDIIPIKFPRNFSFISRLFYTKLMPFSYKFATHYITISENTKNDLINVLHLPEKKITVIPESVNSNFRILSTPKDKEKITQVKQKYHITKDYILSVGTLEPRKNIPFLVRSFAESLKRDNLDAELVIIGKKGWQFDKIFDEIDQQNIKDRVILTGYVTDEDLPYLYNGARLFAFPSLYEGFGLPILEAMACGLPVLSSNTSSLPEVCGPTGILLAPDDQSAWAKNIAQLFSDNALHQQQSQLSLIQSKKFSWNLTAQKTLEVYHELLKQ